MRNPSPVLALLSAALCAAGMSSAHAASEFPSRPLTIVVPTAPGGGNDAMARIIARGLTAKLGQPVVVINKAGGNGEIAADYVARATPDGYTIMFGYIATHGINPALQKLNYDPVKDFTPIGMVASSPTVLVVTNSLPVKNAKELVSLLKAKPDTMSFASGGVGTSPHLAGELFKLSTGVDMLHVSYKGSAPAITDTVAGVTQMMFSSLFTAYPFIQQGRLKAMGIAGEKRSALMKDLPTLGEQGIPDVNMTQWYALFAPAGLPADLQATLNRELNAVLKDPANQKLIEDQGADVETSTPGELKKLVESEVVRWKKVVAAAKIKVN